MGIAPESHLAANTQKIKQKSGNNDETNIFPKKVGIIFIDDISDSKKTLKNTLKNYCKR
jgi:hypothetical protein